MIYNTKIYLVQIIFLLICGNTSLAQINEKESLLQLKSNLEFLASDELEGRYTGSKSEKIAAQFIASELKKYGVKPFGDSSSYFQNFPLVTKKVSKSTNLILSNLHNNKEILELSKDFSLWGEFLPGELDTLKEHEIVFISYGISAPEFNYDDYKNIDIKGKVVAFISGEPYNEDSVGFNSNDPSEHARFISKVFLAASKGAAGIVWIVPERVAKNKERVNLRSFMEALAFPDSFRVKTEPFLPPVIYLYPEGANKLFKNEKLQYHEVLAHELLNVNPGTFNLNKKIRFEVRRNTERLMARNVVGVIDGNNPSLKDEFVVVSAHYDHLGSINGYVFNGADDNASGVVAVLEIARNLAKEKNNSRSVVVVFYTGEEKGSFGSSYFVQTNTNLKNIIANINIDMCGRESVDTIFVVGPDKYCTELNDIIQIKNKELVQFYLDYSNSNYEWIKRTDLAPFYSKEIPMVDFGDDMKEDYHRITDDAFKINYNKIYKTVILIMGVTKEISNMENRLIFSN